MICEGSAHSSEARPPLAHPFRARKKAKVTKAVVNREDRSCGFDYCLIVLDLESKNENINNFMRQEGEVSI